jgi:cystathionine beta-lyase
VAETYGINTLLVRGEGEQSDRCGATVPPIYHSATFHQASATGYGQYNYSRSGNPTREALERTLAALDGGVRALAYPSGVAALDAIGALLLPGDEVVCSRDVYGGTYRLFAQAWQARGIVVRFVDATDVGKVQKACGARTRLIHAEALGNPLLSVCDVGGLAEVARRWGATLSIDNTSLTPLNLRPLERGADIVVHSATKYLNGHSDVTAGVLAVRDAVLGDRLAFHQNAAGSVLAPAECAQLARGLATLGVRLERQERTAGELARRLAEHVGAASSVLYPELAGHPGRETHLRQSRGHGAVFSWCTGDVERSRRIAEGLRLFAICVSFGSVTSSVSMPCFMSHQSVPPEHREHAPRADLLRFSVGLEDVEDLWEDLRRVIGCRNGERP